MLGYRPTKVQSHPKPSQTPPINTPKGGSSGHKEEVKVIPLKELRRELGRLYEEEATAEMEEDCLGGYHCTECFNEKYWIGRDRLKGYENYCPCCGARFV